MNPVRRLTHSLLLTLTSLLFSCGGGGSGGGAASSPGIAESQLELLIDGRTLKISPYGRSYAGADMGSLRSAHSMVQLADGRLFVYGGKFVSGIFGRQEHASAEIFDPATGRWTAGGAASKYRDRALMIALSDNRVLVLDGLETEIADPSARTFRFLSEECLPPHGTGPLSRGAVLGNGKVLVTGGIGNAVEYAGLFDPAEGEAGCFQTLHSGLTQARSHHAMTNLSDGRVLVSGGDFTRESEIFDPSNNTFTPVRGLQATYRSSHSTLLLPDGKVLLAGGGNGNGILTSAEIFDPEMETFTPATNSLSTGRYLPFLIPVATGPEAGKVMVVSGVPELSPELGVSLIEIYDPATGSFSETQFSFLPYQGYVAMAPMGGGKFAFTGGYQGLRSTIILDTGAPLTLQLEVSGQSGSLSYELLKGEASINASGLLTAPRQKQEIQVRISDSSGKSVSGSFFVELD